MDAGEVATSIIVYGEVIEYLRGSRDYRMLQRSL
jgi:hypothetical protein